MRFFTLPKKSQSIVGFTLIELMIAISVVAILSTIGISVYSQGQKFARDARRKSDLKQVQGALNLYYTDFKYYPGYLASGNSTGCSYISAGGYTLCSSGNTGSSGNSPWITGLDSNYINIMPRDPVADTTTDPASNTVNGTGYGYRIYNTTGSANCASKGVGLVYLLYAKLENTNDPDRLGVKNYVWCGDNVPLTGTHSFSPNLYVLGSYI